MANIDIVSEETATWATATHGEEAMGTAPLAPSQMRWSQVSPSLRAAFKLAMTRLEGMMYAVYGSRADYANGLQWYEREHPRCMWGAETWQQKACDDSFPSPWEYETQGKEHAAFGSWPPCCVHTDVEVPIRSRSEDPEYQWFRRLHTDAVFPHGSVDRDLGTTPFDPESTTALFPYLTPAPQDVEVRWVKPAALQTPTSVTLVWNGNNVTMTLSSGAYRGTIPAQAQSTTVYWYIKVLLPSPSDPDTQPAAGTYYDPLVGATPGTAPSDPQAYSFVYFTHYNPYANGLPEMLDICRKGTDRHEFDGSETIQPELINLARFCLQAFGSGVHKQALHHSPLLREVDGACCVSMPIRFRFSGSNRYPHYVIGGKGGFDKVRPLHNNPTEYFHGLPGEPAWGALHARASWRGINMIYKATDYFLNYFYGRGTSWNPFPEEVIIEGGDIPPFTYQIYERFPDAGLMDGDVIEEVHLLEIIYAVEFLVQHGLWLQIPVNASKLTPGTYLGRECGESFSHTIPHGGCSDLYSTHIDYCQKCCKDNICEGVIETNEPCGAASPEPCAAYQAPCDTSSGPPYTCDPWEPPDTCAEMPVGCDLCYTRQIVHKTCYTGFNTSGGEAYETNCDTGGGTACGEASSVVGSYPGSCLPCVDPGTGSRSEVTVTLEGWCGYFCGPTAYEVDEFGDPTTDTLHGNTIHKSRFNHDCTGGGPTPVGTGPSQGNKFGDIRQCGSDVEVLDLPRLWFEEMIGHCFSGLAAEAGWFPDDCNDTSFGPIAGLGNFHPDGSEICEIETHVATLAPNDGHDGCLCDTVTSCACDSEELVCLGCYAWAAIDLNLDGAGIPYGGYDGTGIPGDPGAPSPGADLIPTLYDYNLAAAGPPESECPCETETGPGSCG